MVPAADLPVQEFFRKKEAGMVAEKDASHLPLSGLPAEDPDSKGKRKNCSDMSEMPCGVYEKELADVWVCDHQPAGDEA